MCVQGDVIVCLNIISLLKSQALRQFYYLGRKVLGMSECHSLTEHIGQNAAFVSSLLL